MPFIETEASKRQEIINGKSVTVITPKCEVTLTNTQTGQEYMSDAEALADVQKARLAQLEAVKPKEEAAELFKSLSPLDDVSFATVIKSFKSSADLEAEALKEKGVGGSQAEEPVDKVAEILKAKYFGYTKCWSFSKYLCKYRAK